MTLNPKPYMSDGQNHVTQCEVAEYVGPISLYILWDSGYMCLNVPTNVIALGGAHIAFHGLTTRVHRSTGLDKHNLGRRSYKHSTLNPQP